MINKLLIRSKTLQGLEETTSQTTSPIRTIKSCSRGGRSIWTRSRRFSTKLKSSTSKQRRLKSKMKEMKSTESFVYNSKFPASTAFSKYSGTCWAWTRVNFWKYCSMRIITWRHSEHLSTTLKCFIRQDAALEQMELKAQSSHLTLKVVKGHHHQGAPLEASEIHSTTFNPLQLRMQRQTTENSCRTVFTLRKQF